MNPAIAEKISALRNREVVFDVEAERLIVDAPKGELSDAEREWLKQNKPGIIRHLRAEWFDAFVSGVSDLLNPAGRFQTLPDGRRVWLHPSEPEVAPDSDRPSRRQPERQKDPP